MVFAERQLRLLVLPLAPQGLVTAQDCFLLGLRLATQEYPGLAHVCARRFATLLFRAMVELTRAR